MLHAGDGGTGAGPGADKGQGGSGSQEATGPALVRPHPQPQPQPTQPSATWVGGLGAWVRTKPDDEDEARPMRTGFSSVSQTRRRVHELDGAIVEGDGEGGALRSTRPSRPLYQHRQATAPLLSLPPLVIHPCVPPHLTPMTHTQAASGPDRFGPVVVSSSYLSSGFRRLDRSLNGAVHLI